MFVILALLQFLFLNPVTKKFVKCLAVKAILDRKFRIATFMRAIHCFSRMLWKSCRDKVGISAVKLPALNCSWNYAKRQVIGVHCITFFDSRVRYAMDAKLANQSYISDLCANSLEMSFAPLFKNNWMKSHLVFSWYKALFCLLLCNARVVQKQECT